MGRGPRNLYVQRAHRGQVPLVRRRVGVRATLTEVFRLLGGQEILSSNEILCETLPYKTDKVAFY